MILGQTRLLATPFVPAGMVACAGQTISAQDNPDLVYVLTRDEQASSVVVPAVPPQAPGVRWAMDVTGAVPWDEFGAADQLDPPFVGELVTFVPSFAEGFPAGELIRCDGGTLIVRDHVMLFSAIGITFGGDGSSSFMVPEVASPVGSAMPYYIVGSTGVFPTRGSDWAA